jgi:hypothetical protein
MWVGPQSMPIASQRGVGLDGHQTHRRGQFEIGHTHCPSTWNAGRHPDMVHLVHLNALLSIVCKAAQCHCKLVGQILEGKKGYFRVQHVHRGQPFPGALEPAFFFKFCGQLAM